jgi:Ca2+-binding EF-hand superfamily protein
MVGSIGGFSGVADLAALKERMFKKADANGDGAITLDEFTANAPKDGKGPDAASLFAEIDSDGDGSVSRDESDAFIAKRFSSGMQSVFLGDQEGSSAGGLDELLSASDDLVSTLISSFLSATDTDGDGKVTSDEIAASDDENAKKLFGLFDADGNGTVDDTELAQAKDELQQAFREALVKLQGAQGSDQANGLQGPPPGPPPAGPPRGRDPIDEYAAAADADGDGTITKAEATAADDSDTANKVFDALDTNKDGTVDATELAAARDQLHQFRQALLKLQESLTSGTAEAA